jgi:signal transduction histidine kinase
MMTSSITGWWDVDDPLEIGYVAVVFVIVWALGVLIAARRDHVAELERKTAALEAAERQLADRAVADERARIARELHDVVAHAMSVITVQAGVGAHLIDTRPEQAAEALGVIERTGREALSEMRRMLSVLQGSLDGPRTDPQPGLSDLAQLAEQMRAAGVGVKVETEGSARPLSPGLDLAAYRVVQEGLTNVVKHTPGARAEVAVRYRPEVIEVEVRSRGADVGRPVVVGQGLKGMAERVALYDGALDYGPEVDGFRVAARFPTGTPA